MLISGLRTELLSYFDLNREEYFESHSYLEINMQQWISIFDAAANAVSKIDAFSSSDGFVVVNESNVSSVQQCITDMYTCMNGRASWHRASLILLEYQFLAHFKWIGYAPQFVEYSGWGPCIYDLSDEQLAYYLWWRERAKIGEFAQASGEYIWLFVYECLLNTTGLTPINTRNLLERLYNHYLVTYPKPIHKRLSAEKLGFLIVNYTLYNGLYDDIQRIIQTYGIDDNYRKYHCFSEGKYQGFSKELLAIVLTDVKPKGFAGSEEESFVLHVLPLVFENIARNNTDLHKMILADLCGALNDHARWEFYESPVLSANLARRISPDQDHRSFVVDGNTYAYAAGEDLAANKEIANNRYGYYNDSGDNFHQKGMFYRSQYEGTTPIGRQAVTYVVRELQNKYRTVHGQRNLKTKEFPYSDYKAAVDLSIRSEVSCNAVTDNT